MPFWKRAPADPQAEIREQYHELLGQAQKARLPMDRARLLNLAGDLALALNDEHGALAALSEALDLYLRDRDYHSARAVARKLLRVRSETVRVRSTLAWLAIALDLPGDARIALDLYVTSLTADGQRDYAVRHLTAMARATRDRELRTSIAEYLDTLGARTDADEIRRRLDAEADGSATPPTDDEMRARWEEALDRLVTPA